MDKLNFLTAGIPTIAKDYSDAFSKLREIKLDGLEIEFVHGVRMSEKTQDIVLKNKQDLILTSHGPYYINLNSKEEEKKDASVVRILDTARMANKLGAYSIVYHAGFYMGDSKEKTFKTIPLWRTRADDSGHVHLYHKNLLRDGNIVYTHNSL